MLLCKVAILKNGYKMASKVSKAASKSSLFNGTPNVTDRTAKLSTQMEAKEIGVGDVSVMPHTTQQLTLVVAIPSASSRRALALLAIQ